MIVPVLQIVILTLLFQWVQPQKFLFEKGTISFFRIKGKRVSNRTITYLPNIDHRLFADAVDIKIRTNQMNLYKDAIKDLPHLKVLRLKECGVQILAPGAFKNLPKLEKVHLQDNDLTIIKNGVFNFLPVQELWLQKNEISVIQSGAFDDMPNLESIKLNSNLMQKWDSRWFANTPKLTNLFFRRNKLKELPARAFVNIKTRHEVEGVETVDTKIFLSGNQISQIHHEALQGIDALDELNLKNNKLEKIDSKVFSHLSELHKLNLVRNLVTEIDEDAFENLKDLELNLTRNSLECLPYQILSSVKSVQLTENEDFSCDCLYNLRSKLSGQDTNKIIPEDLDCIDDDDED